MANGHALCIGLNTVDPAHYQGWDGKLNAPEKDAEDIGALVSKLGYRTQILKGNKATRQNVIAAIDYAASRLDKGDIFVVFYSGHGGQLPDFDGDEDDSKDETWCLYDGELLDDEIRQRWVKFKEDVRIFVLSDSCHSGSVAKMIDTSRFGIPEFAQKVIPDEIALSTYLHNKDLYDEYIRKVDADKAVFKDSDIKATVRLISGCQDNQSSYDGAFNSKFTEQLLKVWNGGKFSGNYSAFHLKIASFLPAHQSPNHLVFGKQNPAYDAEIPFTIGNGDVAGSKFMVDLSNVSLDEKQAQEIDSAIQNAVSSELAKMKTARIVSVVPPGHKKRNFRKIPV